MPSYNPQVIEPRWQRYWEENKTFKTPDVSDRPKFYLLDMFPYPSGAGLHVGHPEGYTATDILARYRRMCGDNVLHPMGWDAFGLPAEKYAVKTGTHPRITTRQNIDTFRRQIKMLGFSYDWDREVDTTDPDYFKWTQWIFLQIFDTWYDAEQQRGRPISELPIPPEVRTKGETAVRQYQDAHRLAYQAEVPVNWCQQLGTVLANEEVEDGKSKEEGFPVVRMPLRQWMLRITAYADRLLADLALVDWPESIKKLQRDWIGRSEGAEVDFFVAEEPLCEQCGSPMRLRESSGGKVFYGCSAYPKCKGTRPASVIRVFTTRPDTLFGATYMVLAPEHALVERITTPAQRQAVKAYQAEAARKSERERTEEGKKKTGVFTGAYALNPVNEEKIPIWIADYVLATYGTGAIMAVPAHDERDFEFATQFELPIRVVVNPPMGWFHKHPMISPGSKLKAAFTEEGYAVNSGSFDGLPTAEFKQRITAWLEEKGVGAAKVNYKLRDWLFSRQRYWGEPFPILHEVDEHGNETGIIEPLSLSELPLRLPDLEDFKPSGRPEPLLGKATDWVHVERNGKRYKRETNTMPQWAGSCWYYLRYIDPQNDRSFCDPKKERYWMPVDLYVGGAEHAVLHLLYARFWHKVLFDRGHVHTPEPFQRLVNQGMILGDTDYHVTPEVYEANRERIASMGLRVFEPEFEDVVILRNPSSEPGAFSPLTDEQVVKERGKILLKGTQIELVGRADKMSKARGNVVNPDKVVEQYGADSLRLYEMFMGPLEATKPWSMRGVEGVSRFLSRVWRLFIDERTEQVVLSKAVEDVPADRDTERKLHQTIKKVTEDLDGMRFNTAIAAMMEFTNHVTKLDIRPRVALEPFVLLLSPFAPHLAEELWRALGHEETLAYEPWPPYDPELVKEEEIEVPVQINGKVRTKLTVPAGIDKETLEKTALADERVRELIASKQIKKVIVVPGKLVNIVVA